MRRRTLLPIVPALLLASVVGAQIPVAKPNIAPSFEGWEKNADGTANLLFGYYNRSWTQEFDIPIGPDNNISPGDPDQGQPTHFFPRRSRFVFKVHAPKDFTEAVWTLTVNGQTERAYATLKPAYLVDDIVIMNNFGAGGFAGGSKEIDGNKPPHVTLGVAKTLHATVGQPVPLTAVVTDDGIPPPRPMNVPFGGTPNTANGLRLAWFVYRGAGKVTFDPPQHEVWEDSRDHANSPWSLGWAAPPVPPGGKYLTKATFHDPGTYTLRALAHDGGLYDCADITVTVTR
jgi:hypothetical protein